MTSGLKVGNIISIDIDPGEKLLRPEVEADMTTKLVKIANRLSEKVGPLEKVQESNAEEIDQILEIAIEALKFADDYWSQRPLKDDVSKAYFVDVLLSCSHLEMMRMVIKTYMNERVIKYMATIGMCRNLTVYLTSISACYKIPDVKEHRLSAIRFLSRAWKISMSADHRKNFNLVQRQRLLNDFAKINALCNRCVHFNQYATMAAHVMTKTGIDLDGDSSLSSIDNETIIQQNIAIVQENLLSGENVEKSLAILQAARFKSDSLLYLELVALQIADRLDYAVCLSVLRQMKTMWAVTKAFENANTQDTERLTSFFSKLLSPLLVHRFSLINDMFVFIAESSVKTLPMVSEVSVIVQRLYNDACDMCVCSNKKCKRQVSWKHKCLKCFRHFCSTSCLDQDDSRLCNQYVF